MRRVISLVVFAAAVAATVPSPAVRAAARTESSFTEHTFSATATTPARSYWVYLPSEPVPAPGTTLPPRPLLVFLHGCNTSVADAVAETRFNALAEAQDFVVVYPQQTVATNSSAPLADGNGIGCWNWFLPDDQSRDAGEPGTIAGITRLVTQDDRIDPARVYVAGISAGADMAVILGATYPDVYASVGAVAGCAYRTCGDATGALTYQAMGDRARVVPMFVENGTADTLNNMGLATGLVNSWLGAADRADGGLTGSIDAIPDQSVTYGADQTPKPGSGDVCVHNNTWTCPGGVVGFQGSYPYTVLQYDDVAGCDVLDFWVIHGMEHAWPDSPGDGPYSDPLGPDVTTGLWDFFTAHPMTAHPTTTRCAS